MQLAGGGKLRKPLSLHGRKQWGGGSFSASATKGSLMSLLGVPAAWAVTEGFEALSFSLLFPYEIGVVPLFRPRKDYNKLAVKAAKPIIETPPKPAGEAPNDAVQVIGGCDGEQA